MRERHEGRYDGGDADSGQVELRAPRKSGLALLRCRLRLGASILRGYYAHLAQLKASLPWVIAAPFASTRKRGAAEP